MEKSKCIFKNPTPFLDKSSDETRNRKNVPWEIQDGDGDRAADLMSS
jgi:hypothetical protein